MDLYLRSVKEAGDPADQCREIGVVVGDTITGRESGCTYWHEARLTLLWLGETEAVWREQSRTNAHPDWSEPHEAVNWTLACRRWRKTPNYRAEVQKAAQR